MHFKLRGSDTCFAPANLASSQVLFKEPDYKTRKKTFEEELLLQKISHWLYKSLRVTCKHTTCISRGNGHFHVALTWKTRGVFVRKLIELTHTNFPVGNILIRKNT